MIKIKKAKKLLYFQIIWHIFILVTLFLLQLPLLLKVCFFILLVYSFIRYLQKYILLHSNERIKAIMIIDNHTVELQFANGFKNNAILLPKSVLTEWYMFLYLKAEFGKKRYNILLLKDSFINPNKQRELALWCNQYF